MTETTSTTKPKTVTEVLRERARALREERASRTPLPGLAPAPTPRRPRGRRTRPDAPVDELRRYFLDRKAFYLNAAPGKDLPDEPAALEPFIEAGRIPRGIRPATVVVRPARPAPRGPAAILEQLAKRGIRVIATGDGAVAVFAEAGRLDVATRDAITAALPLLRAYLHGTPLLCSLPNHVGGTPPQAVTLCLGGAPACAECVP